MSKRELEPCLQRRSCDNRSYTLLRALIGDHKEEDGDNNISDEQTALALSPVVCLVAQCSFFLRGNNHPG